MIRLILMTLLTFLGFNFNCPKHDLHKKPTREDYKVRLNLWASMNIAIIGVAAIIFLLIIFTVFCFWIVGVSATESGMIYNNLDKVIQYGFKVQEKREQ